LASGFVTKGSGKYEGCLERAAKAESADPQSPFVASGDTARARVTYQDFLTLWKQADTDVPLLKQAQAEAASLR